MVINNLQYLESLLNSNSKRAKRSAKGARKIPLFKVAASLSAPEIVISPLTPEIYKMMVKLTRSVVESTKQFVRWQNGTCIMTPPQKISEDEDPVVFSFHSDVVGNQSIIGAISQLNSAITRTFTNLTKWLDTWKKYRPLWKVDKVSRRR